MKIQVFIILFLGMFAIGCSKSSDSPAATTTNRASGPFSVKSPTCGSSACLSNAALMAIDPLDMELDEDGYLAEGYYPYATDSKTLLLDYGYEIYNNFKDTIIPGVNQVLYTFEQLAASASLSTCAQIAAATTGNGQDLGSGYTVDVASGSKTIPAEFAASGSTTTRKFTVYNSGTAFAELQLYCNSTTKKTVYVRVNDTTNSQKFEFWSESDSASDAQVLYGAFDQGTAKYTVFFKTAAGTAFELYTIGNGFTYSGSSVDFALAGGANLSTGTADIKLSLSGALPSSYSADSSSWASSPTNIRHCYTSITSPAIDSGGSTCSGLMSFSPATNAVRSGTAWTPGSSGGMNTAISTTF